jgi:hypothetical protein
MKKILGGEVLASFTIVNAEALLNANSHMFGSVLVRSRKSNIAVSNESFVPSEVNVKKLVRGKQCQRLAGPIASDNHVSILPWPCSQALHNGL